MDSKHKIALAISEFKSSERLNAVIDALDIDIIFTYSNQALCDHNVYFMNMILNWYGPIVACDRFAAKKCEFFKRKYVQIDLNAADLLAEITKIKQLEAAC